MPILMSGNLDVVILCGGLGTRLGALTQQTPKPLIRIGQYPFLAHLLKRLQREGFRNFILAVHHLAGQFYDFVETHRSQFPGMTLIEEKIPFGTGGALRHAASRASSETFLAMNGDSMVSQSLAPVLQFHGAKKSIFTMVAVRKENVEVESHNKGGIQIGANHDLVSFRGHQTAGEEWVNAGVYAANRSAVLSWPEGSFNLENKLESLLKPDKACVFKSDGFLLDIGTPQSLKKARGNDETDSLLFS